MDRLPDDTLEYHIYLDPPSDGESPAEARLRCHAALTAIRGRLAPRLAGSVWHREPFAIWLWEPARDAVRAPRCPAARGYRQTNENTRRSQTY